MRAVVDTNVLFEGLTRMSASARVIDAWVAGEFDPCVSTALAYEYQEVLARLGRAKRGHADRALQALLSRCSWVPIYFSFRPASPDPGDDHVVNCVVNASAALVTSNTKHFRQPGATLGFAVHETYEFIDLLKKRDLP